jgi:hypothetical protein
MEVSVTSRIRPFSAAHASRTRQDKLTVEILETGRKLSKTHISLVKEGRGIRIPAPIPLLPLSNPSIETPNPPPMTVDALVIHREQGTSPLTTFQESYMLQEPVRASTLQPFVHNIHIEAFQPVAKRRKNQSLRRSLQMIPSVTPDKMTPFNSHVLKEYRGLMLTGREVSPQRPPYGIRKMSDPGAAPSNLTLRTSKKPEVQRAECERKHPNRVQRFAKRPLSASFSFRNTGSVFDPYDVYNVANGLFACR